MKFPKKQVNSATTATHTLSGIWGGGGVPHWYMPDSHKFEHYHWIRVHINHARAEIARVGIRYSLFQKQEKNHLHQQ